MSRNFTTPIRITRGKRAGRIGYIAGSLHTRNRHVTKCVVRFSADEWSTYDLDALAPCGPDVQGELAI